MEDLQAGSRLIELTESYFNVKDGIRDKWSEKLKKILFDYIFITNEIDYLSIGKILREKFLK